MGRIPKAEKVKAIEVLRNSDQPLSEEDFYLLEEEDPETSYSKRFEKRQELDKNLKILAENVLKACEETGPPVDPSIGTARSPSTSSRVATVKRQMSKSTAPSLKTTNKQSSVNSDDADLIAIIDNMDANIESGSNGRKNFFMESREDYMNRFLTLLFEKQDK